MSAILGKFAAKMMKKDKSGVVENEVKHLEKVRQTQTMKRKELEEAAKSKNEDLKSLAKEELRRRGENKTLTKDLKDKQASGKLTEKQVKNRMEANKQKAMGSDSIRDSIQKQYDRMYDTEDFNKGGMVKKKPMAYAKGGMANCGASVPASQKGKKK